MKTKKLFLAIAVFISLATSLLTLTSCDKAEGMDNDSAFYSYISGTKDFNYQDAAGPFDTAIRFSVGLEPILGGADDKVIEACNTCYETLKPKLKGRSGKVYIYKTRHPDGKQIILKEYKFD